MHNIKDIRKDFNNFKEKLKNRNIDTDLDNIISLDEQNRKLIQEKETLEMEKKAIEVMQQYGMKIKKPTEEEIAVWNDFKDEITPDVVETFLSTEIYEKVISAINE